MLGVIECTSKEDGKAHQKQSSRGVRVDGVSVHSIKEPREIPI